jgi:hypothetical protein
MVKNLISAGIALAVGIAASRAAAAKEIEVDGHALYGFTSSISREAIGGLAGGPALGLEAQFRTGALVVGAAVDCTFLGFVSEGTYAGDRTSLFAGAFAGAVLIDEETTVVTMAAEFGRHRLDWDADMTAVGLFYAGLRASARYRADNGLYVGAQLLLRDDLGRELRMRPGTNSMGDPVTDTYRLGGVSLSVGVVVGYGFR